MRCNYKKREVIRYRLSFARLSCASGSMCSSSSKSSSSKAKKLSWTEAAELTTMAPSKATDRYDADQFNNAMEGLIRLGNASGNQPPTTRMFPCPRPLGQPQPAGRQWWLLNGPCWKTMGLPLYYTNEATLVKTSVKGVVFNGAGSPYNFKEAYIK